MRPRTVAAFFCTLRSNPLKPALGLGGWEEGRGEGEGERGGVLVRRALFNGVSSDLEGPLGEGAIGK